MSSLAVYAKIETMMLNSEQPVAHVYVCMSTHMYLCVRTPIDSSMLVAKVDGLLGNS